jgi:hypothetical protein
MNLELNEPLKNNLGQFCQNLFNIIQKNNKIYCIIIQYKNDQIFLGTNKNGKYVPKYYDPTNEIGYEQELIDIIQSDQKKQLIIDLINAIHNNYPNFKFKSFNIFYHKKNQSVNVCKNRIGSKSMNSSRLFKEFNITNKN